MYISWKEKGRGKRKERREKWRKREEKKGERGRREMILNEERAERKKKKNLVFSFHLFGGSGKIRKRDEGCE